MSRTGYSNIEYPEAYDRATTAHIYANARKGRHDRWLAADASRVALERALNAAINTGSNNSFLFKMQERLVDWGDWSEGQEAAVRKILGQMNARAEERAARVAESKAHDAATSKHIGSVKERRHFAALTINMVRSYDTQYGTTFIHVMHDDDGNVVVYKGTKELGERNEVISLTASIKEHGVRDGVAQTIIWHPKDVAVARIDGRPVTVRPETDAEMRARLGSGYGERGTVTTFLDAPQEAPQAPAPSTEAPAEVAAQDAPVASTGSVNATLALLMGVVK